MSKQAILQQFNEIESVLKAQVVGGPGSNPLEGKGSAMTNQGKDWAGSSQTDLDFPNTTPNGTDWNPKSGDRTPHSTASGRTRKSVKDFSDEELAYEMQFRKSGVPNPTKADQEIMTSVGGVTKAVCPSCDGNALMKGWYCQTCNNLGHIYSVGSDEAAGMIKSIQQKWNVDKIDETFWKSQNVNTGGGVDEADTTPKNKTDMRDEKEDHTGEMVAKGEAMAQDMDEEAEGLEGGDDEGFGGGDDMEEEEGGEEMDYDMDKCGKGIDHLKRSLAKAMKGLAFLSRQNVALSKALYLSASMSKATALQVADQGEDIGWITQNIYKSQQQETTQKSLGGQQAGNGPMRGPNAFGPGVQLNVMQKSFVDQAPGGMEQMQQQQGQPQQSRLEHSYSPDQLKKAATYMGCKRLMPRRAALSLETGAPLDENVEKALVRFLDKHEGNVPALEV